MTAKEARLLVGNAIEHKKFLIQKALKKIENGIKLNIESEAPAFEYTTFIGNQIGAAGMGELSNELIHLGYTVESKSVPNAVDGSVFQVTVKF